MSIAWAVPKPAGSSEALTSVLSSLERLMQHSRRLTLEAANGGMAPVLLELLRRPSAQNALLLLEILRGMYEHTARPKASLWGGGG
jgi:hypothetical protein